MAILRCWSCCCSAQFYVSTIVLRSRCNPSGCHGYHDAGHKQGVGYQQDHDGRLSLAPDASQYNNAVLLGPSIIVLSSIFPFQCSGPWGMLPDVISYRDVLRSRGNTSRCHRYCAQCRIQTRCWLSAGSWWPGSPWGCPWDAMTCATATSSSATSLAALSQLSR